MKDRGWSRLRHYYLAGEKYILTIISSSTMKVNEHSRNFDKPWDLRAAREVISWRFRNDVRQPVEDFVSSHSFNRRDVWIAFFLRIDAFQIRLEAGARHDAKLSIAINSRVTMYSSQLRLVNDNTFVGGAITKRLKRVTSFSRSFSSTRISK